MFLLDKFHDFTGIFLVLILRFVAALLGGLSVAKTLYSEFVDQPALEFFWTVLPSVLLLLVGCPSLFVLYSHEVEGGRELTVKITGHQWYWTYDYSDFLGVEFDSFISPSAELPFGGFRLLEVDSRSVLPFGSSSRFIISSADVLHSWAVPSFGVKADACPGRINLVFSFPLQVGLFFGQCREICGANHSFIPIGVEVVRFSLFSSWISGFF